MTLENLLSQIGSGTKQLTDRYSDYASPVHDHDHVFYAYEPSAPSHGHVATSKHHYGGGGHKSGASMSALTLLAFLFFLHILQQCIKDHMTDMSSTQPVMVMTAGREGDETISKSASNKVDKTGMTTADDKINSDNNQINQNEQNKIMATKITYDYDDSSNKNQLQKVHTTAYATKSSEDQKYKYVIKNNANRSSYFSGYVSAMDEE
ncbi:uncharacterized protein LOC142977329 [Anticarsia gemmatalis]|uniref:uncharacterized protein LOC142977329 n=1 Tax=Anticarsia gemmatalis TaxID=129554 RepID=UPI003F7609B3